MSKLQKQTQRMKTQCNRFARVLRCEHLEDRRMLAIVTVNTVADVVDFTDGVTSLREAIFATNTVPGADEINFDFRFDGPAVILLTEGELQITDDLTINGPGSELLTIDASGSDPTPGEHRGDGSRIFDINDSDISEYIEVHLQRLTVTGADISRRGAISSRETLLMENVSVMSNLGTGIWSDADLTITNCIIADNAGGGISSSGDLSILLSQITNNAWHGIDASSGGNVCVSSSQVSSNGANGLYVQGASIIEKSTISNNQYSGIESFGVTSISESKISGNARGGIVSSGTLELNAVDILHNSSYRDGSGIYAVGSTMITNSVISGNRAGSGIYARGTTTIIDSEVTNNTGAIEGGGILAYGEMGIINSEISSNAATHYGGGIHNQGVLSISRSTISGNATHVIGGGISSFGQIRLYESTIMGNKAAAGGGVYTRGGTEINSSTISNNTAGFGGGAIGARLQAFDSLEINNSTLSGNTVGNSGGGIWLAGTGRAIVAHSTVTKNIAETNLNGLGSGGGIFVHSGFLSLDHAIVAGNLDNSGVANGIAGIFSSNFTLIGAGAEFLGPLQDNGGPTLTHALLPGSPAINAGGYFLQPGTDGLPEFDQRGVPFGRVIGGRIDIGAYESQAASGSLHGDFDGDRDIDGYDFLTWQRSVSDNSANGDTNGDGDADEYDLEVWRETYSTSAARPLRVTASAVASEVVPFSLALANNKPTRSLSDEQALKAHYAFVTEGNHLDQVLATPIEISRTGSTSGFGGVDSSQPTRETVSINAAVDEAFAWLAAV